MSSEKLYYKKYLKYKQKYKILQTQIGGSPNIDLSDIDDDNAYTQYHIDKLKEIYKFLQKNEYIINKFKVKNNEDYNELNDFFREVTNYLMYIKNNIKNNIKLNTKIITMYKSLLKLKSYIVAELIRVTDPNCYFPNFDVKLNTIQQIINDFLQYKEEINSIDILNWLQLYASIVKYNIFLYTVSNSKTIVDLITLDIIKKQDIDDKKKNLLRIDKNLNSLISTYLKNNGLITPSVSREIYQHI